MSKKLAGKIALVTGGSSGIGLGTAKEFVAEGAHVYITGRRKEELDAAAKSLGSNVTAVQSDASKLEDLDRLFATIKEKHGRLDIVFANAGVGEVAPLGEITEAHFDRVFDINVKGLVFTVQKALPLLKDGSSIILNASIAGIKGMPAFSVYSATKAAVRSFARTWTTDLKHRKIRVNAISPGPIQTPAIDGLADSEQQRQQFKDDLANQTPLGRWGRPDEVGKAAVFLASDDASFITGAELFVDGGLAQV
ncbi:MAG: glucose 1-dehydrogenase [Anaerolineae bacterium]|nr:glucose 1-dehydrogenase [Phycisphaerae bacterium]